MSAQPEHADLLQRATRQPWRLSVLPVGCNCCAALNLTLGTVHAVTFKMRDEEIRDARSAIDLYLERKLRSAEDGVPLAVTHSGGFVERQPIGRRASDYRTMRNLQQTRNNLAYLVGQMANEGREGNHRGMLEMEIARLDRELEGLTAKPEPIDSPREEPALETA